MMGSATTARTGSDWQVLDGMLPRDHLLRRTDRLLDLDELRATLDLPRDFSLECLPFHRPVRLGLSAARNSAGEHMRNAGCG